MSVLAVGVGCQSPAQKITRADDDHLAAGAAVADIVVLGTAVL
jgi:hypothetical protein